mgnify:CR=1 FL=1
MRTVDVSNKPKTLRTARAYGRIRLKPQTVKAIKEGRVPKGDVLSACRLAGIMATKKTSQLLPFCHPITFEHVELEVRLGEDFLEVFSFVKGIERTGYEMEALTAVSVALLTVYDMCKGMDDRMAIEEVRLLEKSGGKSQWSKSPEGLRVYLDLEGSLRLVAEEYLKGACFDKDAKLVITTQGQGVEPLWGLTAVINTQLFGVLPEVLKEGVLVGKKDGKLFVVLQEDERVLRAFFENFLGMLAGWGDG